MSGASVHRGRTWRGALMLGMVLGIPLATLGGAPREQLVFAVGAAVFVAPIGLLANEAGAGERSVVRRASEWLVLTCGAVLALEGAFGVLGSGGLLVLAGLAAVVALVAEAPRLGEAVDRMPVPARRAGLPRPTRRRLAGLDSVELMRAWHESLVALQDAPPAQAVELVEWRRRCLDEIERRSGTP